MLPHREVHVSRPLSFYQREYDARVPVDDVECDGGMVPCQRCGRTGRDPLYDYDCSECGGDGSVRCPGCSECGAGESEVFHV